MQRTSNSSNSIDWQPGAAPKTACVVQAVLLSAAVAVLFQSVINLWLGLSAFALQLGGFLVVFPFAWRLLGNGQGMDCDHLAFDRVCFELDGVVGERDQTGERVPLKLLDVGRFLGAMQIRFKPICPVGCSLTTGADAPVAITVWKSTVGQEKFRKIAVMTQWHARRVA